MKYTIDINCLGEFRMGVNGYGMTILSEGKKLDFLKDKLVFANSAPPSDPPDVKDLVDRINNKDIIVIKGAFSTFLVDIRAEEASLFKHTIRAPKGVWCEESAIYGSESFHFTGKSGDALLRAISICKM